jgi:outer membrane protein TolC
MELTKRLNYSFKTALLVATLAYGQVSSAQSLDQCHDWAINASAAMKQSDILSTIEVLKDQNLRNSNLPTLQVNGSASYQSDVFGLPFSIPGSEAPVIPQDQYSLTLNIQQKLFDGGINKKQRAVSTAESLISQTEVDIQKDQIIQIVNELYFGILQTEALLKLQSTILAELENRKKAIQTGIDQGVLLASNLKRIEKEELKTIQQQVSLELKNQALRQSLSDWTQQDLMMAEIRNPTIERALNREVNRKELQLFDQQQTLLKLQSDLTSSTLQPKLYAFGNVGVGQPNPFNFFETDLNSFYILGAKLQWQIWDWGNTKRNREVLSEMSSSVATKKDHFLRQIDQKQTLLLSEIQQLESQLTTDQQLIYLQQDIVDESSLRLQEGTLSQSDFLTEFNILNQIKSQAITHQIQLDFQRINYLTWIGQL